MRLQALVVMVSALIVGVVVSSCANRGRPVTIGLWAKPGAEKDHRVTEVRDHFACDARVAYMATRSIPSRGPFEAELVVEFDESGRVIQRWGMPVDSSVAGVEGDRLIVPRVEYPVEGPPALSISPTGKLSLTTLRGEEPELIACPVLREFKGSAYARCWAFRDLATGKVRRLAYNGPCT